VTPTSALQTQRLAQPGATAFARPHALRSQLAPHPGRAIGAAGTAMLRTSRL
jgi:hypothetical protein